MSSPHVLIIGAGISGLACAAILADHGLSVTVVDKARGPGGRASSKRLAQGTADLGAQYFTARDPAFCAQVDQWAAQGCVAQWAPRLATATPGHWTPSPDQQIRWVGAPKMGALAHAMAGPIHITPESRVIKVGAGTVELEDGQTLSADHLVLACPADQTQALIPDLPLPAQAPCWALWMDIDSEQPFDAAFVKDSPIGWIAQDSSKPGRAGSNRWVAHAAPEWSQQHLEVSADQAAQALIQACREVLPSSFEVLAHGVHRWRYARPWAQDENRAQGYLAVDHQLSVCGDYLNGGRVEGAWLSGHHCGLALADALT